jgi:aromatic amino acid aminotransferase I
MKINWQKHSEAKTKGIGEIESTLFDACIEQRVLLTPGSWFCAERNAHHEDMFFRATFAAAPADQMSEAIKRFGIAIRAIFKLN